MPITVSNLISHPLLWRITGFVSSIVGFICYALSPSFQGLFGQWNPLKIVIYSLIRSLLSILMLFVKTCKWGLVRSFLLKAHVGFMVLTLTSLYSFLEDRSEEVKKEEKVYGRVMNVTSTGAFALMAMSLSRQLELGFEVGVFNFLLGCFLVTVMKMNLKLAPVAAFFCYLLVNIRSFSDFLLEMRGKTGHADEENSCIVVTRGYQSDTEDDSLNLQDLLYDSEDMDDYF